MNKIYYNNKKDLFLWCIIFIISICGVFGNYYYLAEYLFIKILWFLFFFVIVSFLISKTSYGYKLKNYINGSIVEFYKIVWPTKKEVRNSMFSVLIMIFVVSFLLWVIDVVILLIIGYIIKYNVGV